MFPIMVRATKPRVVVVVIGLLGAQAWAQGATEAPATKIVVVPSAFDGGHPVGAAPAGPAQALPPPPEMPPPEGSGDVPSRTIEALPPPPLPEQLDASPQTLPPQGPTAMLDGHPREGAFLSGPGSLTFLLHHTLMTGLGGLATQMVPRALVGGPGFSNEDARLAYLGMGLGGAAVGFAGSAVWQFTHWMSHSTASFGIVNSAFGGMFLGGLTNLLTSDAYAISWLTLVGSLAGAWLTPMVGGGDLPINHGVLITTGGVWAAIYTSLVVAIIATTGGAVDSRSAIDAIMLTPAIGAAALALATLKFNPSTAQVMRANLFGLGVGGAVLLISALVLAGHFNHPAPYILAGVGAIGAQTLVSLLWVEAAENPAAPAPASMQPARARAIPWW
jgi:hypothetical protein